MIHLSPKVVEPQDDCPDLDFELIRRARPILRGIMANHEMVAGDAADTDYAEHEKTYRSFLALAKWTLVFLVVLLILMAYFLL